MTINPPLELSRWVGGRDAIKCMNGKKTVLHFIYDVMLLSMMMMIIIIDEF